MVNPIGGGSTPSSEPPPETSGPSQSAVPDSSESSIFLSDTVSNPFLQSILEGDSDFDYSIKGYMGLLQDIRIMFDDLDENEILVDLAVSGSIIEQLLSEIRGFFQSIFGNPEVQLENKARAIEVMMESYKENRINYAELDGIQNFINDYIENYNEVNGTSIGLLSDLPDFPDTPIEGSIAAQETLDILNYNVAIEEINAAMAESPLLEEFPSYAPMELFPYETNLEETIDLVNFYNSDLLLLSGRVIDYNEAAQDYNDALDQYVDDYAQWQTDHNQWQTDHDQWETDHDQWVTDYQAWIDGGQSGAAPVEPQEPAEPEEPVDPATYLQWLIDHKAWVDGGEIGTEPAEPYHHYTFTVIPDFPLPPTTSVLEDGYPIIDTPLPSITAPPDELTLDTRDDIITYNESYEEVNNFFQDTSDYKDVLNFLFEDVYEDTFDNNELVEGIITDYPTNNLADINSVINFYNVDEVSRINEWLEYAQSRAEIGSTVNYPKPPGGAMDESTFENADFTLLPSLPNLSDPPTAEEIADYNSAVAIINDRMSESHLAEAYPTTVTDSTEARYYWKPLPEYTTSSADFTSLETQHQLYTEGLFDAFNINPQSTFGYSSAFDMTEALIFQTNSLGESEPDAYYMTYINQGLIYAFNTLAADGDLDTYDRFRLLPDLDVGEILGNPLIWAVELGFYDALVDLFMAPIEAMIRAAFDNIDSAAADERKELEGLFSILRSSRFAQEGSVDNILNNEKPLHQLAQDYLGGDGASQEDMDIPSIFNFSRDSSPELLTLTIGEQKQKTFNPAIVNLFIDPSFRAGYAGLIKNIGLAGGIKGLQAFKEQEVKIKESVKTTVFGQVSNPVTPDFEAAAGIGLALSFLEAANAKNVEKLAAQLFATLPIEVQEQFQGQLKTDLLEDLGILIQSTFLNIAVRTLNLYSPNALNSITLSGQEFNARLLNALTANRSQLLGSVISFLAATGTTLDGASSGGIPPYGDPLSLPADKLELLLELLSGQRDDLETLLDGLSQQQLGELTAFFNLENSIIQTSIDTIRIQNEEIQREVIKDEIEKRRIDVEQYGLSLPEPGTSLIAFSLKEEAIKQLGNNLLGSGPLLGGLSSEDIIALENDLKNAGILGDLTIQEAIKGNRSLILQSIQSQSPSDRIREELSASVLGYGSFVNLGISQSDLLALANNILAGKIGEDILTGLSDAGKNRLKEVVEELMVDEELDRQRTGIPNSHDLLNVSFNEIVHELGVDYAEKIVDDARSLHRRDDQMTIFLRALLDPGIVFIKEFSMQTATKSFLTQDANAIRT